MSHVHTPHSGSDNLDMFTQEFWDARYRSANRIWSGSPNPHLVARVADLSSGTALDVGGGEGADAIWLASLGWQVTAIDVSTVALDRAAEQAATAGRQVADRITWQRAYWRAWLGPVLSSVAMFGLPSSTSAADTTTPVSSTLTRVVSPSVTVAPPQDR